MTTNDKEPTAVFEPCPWCGAANCVIVENGKMWRGTKFSAPVSVSVMHHCKAIPGQPSRMIERIGRDRESAIAAWNARALSAQAAPTAHPEDQQATINALREFAQDVMQSWPEGDVDGADLQDMAVRHGLLRLKTPAPTEPCGEGCACAGDAFPEDWASGIQCYEKTDLLKGTP